MVLLRFANKLLFSQERRAAPKAPAESRRISTACESGRCHTELARGCLAVLLAPPTPQVSQTMPHSIFGTSYSGSGWSRGVGSGLGAAATRRLISNQSPTRVSRHSPTDRQPPNIGIHTDLFTHRWPRNYLMRGMPYHFTYPVDQSGGFPRRPAHRGPWPCVA